MTHLKLILLMTLLALAQPAFSEPKEISSGVGNMKCPDYRKLIQYKEDNSTMLAEQVIGWSQGYLSGRNSEAISRLKAATEESMEAASRNIPTREYIRGYLDNYCKQYDFAHLWQGLDKIYEESR